MATIYKDKNETILKVGDTIENKKGEKGKLENIHGVTRLVHRDSSGRIKQTTTLSKIDLSRMEKVA